MDPTSQSTEEVYTKKLNLWVHEAPISKQDPKPDVILNPDCLPGIKYGQLLELYHPSAAADRTKHLVVQVVQLEKDFIKQQPALQVSVSKEIANHFGFFGVLGRKEVIARAVDVNSVAAEFIELTFRDQYIGRSDMWRLSTSLTNICVYVGRKIEFTECIRAQVKRICVKGELVSGGYITAETKAIFRSESAKYFIFVQMSREMWEFDEDGELFFEKAIDGFLPDLFHRWKEMGTNHVVSVVLFSRIFYEYDENLVKEGIVKHDHQERWYKDFYKVIVDWEAHSDWMAAIVPLKKELLNYPQDILLRKKGDYEVLSGQNSCAFEGNILEAINLALNPFDKHYVDRDLLRTGLAIIIVTPGTGRFEVDKKLLRITTERMIDNGIGLDLVCLSKIPLHTVPLFQFKSQDPSKAPLPDWWKSRTGGSSSSKSQTKDMKPENRDPLDYDEASEDATVIYYKTPDWIDCNFYSRDQDKPFKPDKFVPRCKMYEIQMMGIMEHEISSILVPFLDKNYPPVPMTPNYYDTYDEEIFSNDFIRPISTKSRPSGDSIEGKDRTLGLSNSHPSHENYLSVPISGRLTVTAALTMSTIHPNQIKKVTSSPGVHGSGMPSERQSNSLEEDRLKIYNMPNVTTGHISKNDSQLHDIFYHSDSHGPKSAYMGPISSEDDDGTVLTSSTVKPISIKSPKQRTIRNFHRESSPSPKNSFVDNFKSSYSSEKGRYFLRQSPGKLLASKQPHKQTLVNPCNPAKGIYNRPILASHLRRWEHIFPKRLLKNTIKWTSLCTPACLPLTTDFFPPINEQGAYHEYTYTISVDPEGFTIQQDDNTSEERKTEMLLKEMISQRLAQGYQLIIPSSASIPNSKPSKGSENNHIDISKSIIEAGKSTTWKEQQPMPNLFSASIPCYLSMGHQVHILTFDPSGQNVEVKRYLRKTQYSSNPIPYSCVVWPKYQDNYETRNVLFNYPHSDYKWNYVDQLVAGYQDVLLETLKFWRTRFILIPMENFPNNATLISTNENLDEEEVRVNGIYNFLEIFQKAVWISPNEMRESAQKKKFSKPKLILTTLDPSVYVKTPDAITSRRGSIHHADERLNKDSKLSTIAQALLHPVTGIVRERRWHLRQYENAIVGNELVDWLIKHFSDIDSRESAIEFGNELQRRDLFDHCTKRHKFMDGYYYYQLKKEYAPQKSSKSWFGNSKITKDSEKIESPTMKPQETIQTSLKSTHVELSRAIQIDIDPNKKSDRKETAILHYDVLHNPDNCYHFQLNWLGCTARLIEDMLQGWSRTASKYGLKLVEAPVEQAISLTDNNPFQSPTIVKLAAQPPSLDAIGKKLHPAINPYLYFEIQLVKRFKFILDVEADDRFPDDVKVEYSYFKTPYKYSQYIHRSGVAFIQIREPGEGYLWVNNRLVTTQTVLAGAQGKPTGGDRASPVSSLNAQGKPVNDRDPDILLKTFQKFCEDENELKKFWDEAASKLPALENVEEAEQNESSLITQQLQPNQKSEQ
ncbi:hypothetical protein G9A89_015710 [Geosiphon pyriformis]|nr:hypothetical protein G9A89_015710 [Geosiphon pyriformis]